MASDEPPAKRARLASLPVEAARTQQACTACRERKIKCCGNQPCRYCSKRGLDCAFVEVGRKKLYPVAYVEELERKLSGNAAGAAESSNKITHADVSQTAVPSIHDIPNADSDSSTSPIISEPTMSSSLDFGTRIRDLTRDSHTPNVRGGPILSHETPDNVYDIEPESAPRHRSKYKRMQWPNEEEAHAMLNSVTSSIGSVQHLIDPRTFSDTLSQLYDSEFTQPENIELHHVEMLMVFSLGGLLQGKIKSGSSFPGAEYFLEAVNNLPSLCALRKAGSLAIELMGLFAFFLQCSDRKDDAYIYAGLALRLAISNGLARGQGGHRMKRSESVHRNRLWWTIYMQERRIAAATGNPVGILDENITARLPTESAGFPPVAALNINIQLAKMTGRILQNIYSARHRSERQFLRTIHDLVTELNNLHKDIPPSCKVDVSQPGSLTRTSATLSLMFSQAVILTTRPILLHLAKSGLGGNNPNNALTGMSRSQKLADTCIEAAGVSLDVLHLLRQQALLAKFGFFDLDATVSAAFVFMLVECIYPRHSSRSGIQGIRGARDILKYLSECGNKAADKRLHDVQQLCEHLQIPLDHPPPPNNESTSRAMMSNNLEDTLINSMEHTQTASHPHEPSHPVEDIDWRQALASLEETSTMFGGINPDGEQLSDSAALDQFDDFNFDLNGDFLLTGADEIDWEEFSRQITRNNNE